MAGALIPNPGALRKLDGIIGIGQKSIDDILAVVGKRFKSLGDNLGEKASKGFDGVNVKLQNFESAMAATSKEMASQFSKLSDKLSSVSKNVDKLTNVETALKNIPSGQVTKVKKSKMKRLGKIISVKNICLVAGLGAGLYIIISAAIESGYKSFKIKGIEAYQNYTGNTGDVLITVDIGFAFYDGSARGVPADTITFNNTDTDPNLNTSSYSITHVVNQYSFIINVGKTDIKSITPHITSSDSYGLGDCVLYRSFEASMSLQAMQVGAFAGVLINTVVTVGLQTLQAVTDQIFSSGGIGSQILDAANGVVNDVIDKAGGAAAALLGTVTKVAENVAQQLADAAAAAAKAAAGVAGGAAGGLGGLLGGIGDTIMYVVIAVVGIIIFLNMTKK